MTTMAALNTGFNAALNVLAYGAAAQFAGGLMASFARPLGAGPFAFGQLPNRFDVGVGQCGQPPQSSFTATLGANGRGSVDLGDGYSLQLNERNSEITIKNSATGEQTRIWGDPHVEIDGKHAFDFWGTTSFTLANGTKITINTEQFGGNPNEYVASQVVVTRGDNAITINGISQNKLGDLSVTMGQNGRQLDAATRDGYTLHENQTGAGWRTEVGTMATQQHLNATRVGAQFGPGSGALSLAELSQAFGAFLTLGILTGGLALAAQASGETGGAANARVRLAVD